jgi:CPA1 family monovalent cation:H+ antiporter
MQLRLIAALVIAGIIVGVAFPGRLTDVFGVATLYVFLPALIFEGAWRLHPPTMRRAWAAITLLAVPGVLFTAVIIAICVHYFGHLPWISALLLGAILSATDPIAVLAIFRRLRLPNTLTTIIESEALLNDAAAVVLYRAVLAASVIATASLWQVTLHALLGTIFGVACGAAVAAIARILFSRDSNPFAYGIVMLAFAYGSYYLANHFDWSGIFADLTFGIAIRLFQNRRMEAEHWRAVGQFWEGIGLVANGALFFLIGAALDLTRLGPALPIALLTVAAVFLARFATAYGLLHLVRPRLHIAWMTVVRMAGIRGALSLALALATPLAIADRDLIVDATFIVVVVTLLLGSLTLDRRMAGLGLPESHT